MRIDSGGDLLVNKTTSAFGTAGWRFSDAGSNGCRTSATILDLNRLGTDGNSIAFYKDSVLVGTISVSGSATAFNTTSSDEKLKKNITDWNENVLDKFKDIEPKEFHFNNQDNLEEKTKGYIAQNEMEKFPEAYPLVYNKEEKEDRYMFNPSGMTVYLMKAIQELKAEIDILKNK